MFRFGNPSALQLLWLLPALYVVFFVSQKHASLRLKKSFGSKLAPFLSASVSTSRRKLKIILKLLALMFFVIALARPQTGKSSQTIKSEGVEIIIAVDVSTSMLAEDVKPSRLAFAKSEITQLLDLLGGDKVGLVAFAGSAVLLSPITTDKGALKMFLEGLSPQSVENQGTEFKKALSESQKAFERGGVDPDEGVKVTRVVLIASDGEDQEPGALDEAKRLSQSGIRIFTMAFGSERGAPIPLRDDAGILKNYKRDKTGHDVLSKVNDDVLRSIAEAGKGSFYHATPGGNEAKLIRADIDRLEKAQFDSEVTTNYDEKFQIFLFIGLLLAAFDFLIGERKPAGRIWRGRFEVQDT